MCYKLLLLITPKKDTLDHISYSASASVLALLHLLIIYFEYIVSVGTVYLLVTFTCWYRLPVGTVYLLRM